MSEFHAFVFKINEILPHPYADRLEIINVFGGYPCIVEKGKYKVGQLAIYVPVDTVLPDGEAFSFLSPHDKKHLRAKKIRGIFSMGLVIPPIPDVSEGDDVVGQLGVQRWEPVDDFTCSESIADPLGLTFVKYTDIESLRKEQYASLFQVGEEVVLTEKIHGANWRCVFSSGRNELLVGSRTLNKRRPDKLRSSQWWNVIETYDIEKKLQTNRRLQDFILFGEVYGNVGGFSYGTNGRSRLAVFDVFDLRSMQYLDYDIAKLIAEDLEIPWVPELYRGPWTSLQCFLPLAEGNSTITNANNVREGFVVKPVNERFEQDIGRLILKIHGQGFLLKK